MVDKNKATVGQVKCIQAIISKLNLKDKKEAMLLGASEGRVTSTSDLTIKEATILIRHLKTLDPDEHVAEVMRKKIIAMAHEMAWHTKETAKLPRGHKKVDMIRLDAWMVKSSYLHKKLNQYLYNELPKLVTQFEAVYKSFLKGL